MFLRIHLRVSTESFISDIEAGRGIKDGSQRGWRVTICAAQPSV
jgi:hypothetical protein